MRSRALFHLAWVLVALSLVALCAPAYGQDAPPPAPPGFRAPGPYAAAFAEALPDATIIVLPTIVRNIDGATHSLASQRWIVDFLNREKLAIATPEDEAVDLGPAPHASQWEIFHRSLQALSAEMKGRGLTGDYTLMMEVVLPPGFPRVFGIHTHIIDREGRNAFSFLLNSHHPVFVEADLVAAEDTDAAREAMIASATRVGVETLQAQIDHARACAAWMAAHPPQPMNGGVFEDFEAGVSLGQDPHGITLGFSTFTDGPSTVSLEASRSHPPRTGAPGGNTTLQIDLDVTGWAGFTDLRQDPRTGAWLAQDWSDFQGLSFWMYGRGTGTKLFVDVLDNRNPCSVVDDAERYVYEFDDDFTGWKQIRIRFRDMVRKEIGNGAPNDGLGLDQVHGWAFGATATNGPTTWYLDDVALWPAGGS